MRALNWSWLRANKASYLSWHRACLCVTGDVMPHVNVAVMETADYSYLLSLKRATWYEALELCQQYGEGYYLANMDDANEHEVLRPWLTDVANTGKI